METLRWAISLVLGIPSLLLILCNWTSVVGWAIAVRRGHKGGHCFCPPFLTGITGSVACLICPSAVIRQFAWVPPLIDPSIGLWLVVSLMNAVATLVRGASPESDQETDSK